MSVLESGRMTVKFSRGKRDAESVWDESALTSSHFTSTVCRFPLSLSFALTFHITGLVIARDDIVCQNHEDFHDKVSHVYCFPFFLFKRIIRDFNVRLKSLCGCEWQNDSDEHHQNAFVEYHISPDNQHYTTMSLVISYIWETPKLFPSSAWRATINCSSIHLYSSPAIFIHLHPLMIALGRLVTLCLLNSISMSSHFDLYVISIRFLCLLNSMSMFSQFDLYIFSIRPQSLETLRGYRVPTARYRPVDYKTLQQSPNVTITET